MSADDSIQATLRAEAMQGWSELSAQSANLLCEAKTVTEAKGGPRQASPHITVVKYASLGDKKLLEQTFANDETIVLLWDGVTSTSLRRRIPVDSFSVVRLTEPTFEFGMSPIEMEIFELLGATVSASWSVTPLNALTDIVQYQAFVPKRLSAVTLDGRDLKLLEFDFNHADKPRRCKDAKVWMDPEHNWRVVHAEVTLRDGESVAKTSITYDDDNGGVPTKVEYVESFTSAAGLELHRLDDISLFAPGGATEDLFTPTAYGLPDLDQPAVSRGFFRGPLPLIGMGVLVALLLLFVMKVRRRSPA